MLQGCIDGQSMERTSANGRSERHQQPSPDAPFGAPATRSRLPSAPQPHRPSASWQCRLAAPAPPSPAASLASACRMARWTEGHAAEAPWSVPAGRGDPCIEQDVSPQPAQPPRRCLRTMEETASDRRTATMTRTMAEGASIGLPRFSTGNSQQGLYPNSMRRHDSDSSHFCHIFEPMYFLSDSFHGSLAGNRPRVIARRSKHAGNLSRRSSESRRLPLTRQTAECISSKKWRENAF